MHLSLTETGSFPPSHHWNLTADVNHTDLQASNGKPLYAYPANARRGSWMVEHGICTYLAAGRPIYVTSLFKLGWAGLDEAVYVDRVSNSDDQREVDILRVGESSVSVSNCRGVPLKVIMPEKICLMPASGASAPSVIFAASDEDTISCIFNSLEPGAIVRDLKHLEDFWVNRGKLWVMTRGEMHSLSEPVNRKLRIYGPDGDLEKEVELSCVACGRPIFVKDKLVFPVQRWSNGPWELTTGSECLWKGVGISNLFTYREGVLCLVSDRPRVWRTLRDGSCSSFGELGEPVGDVSMWDGKLLFHMRDKEREYVVYDSRPSRVFGEIDHASLRVFKGEPVYAARETRGSGLWQLVYDNALVGQPSDRILEIDAATKILRTCVLRDDKLVTELYKI